MKDKKVLHDRTEKNQHVNLQRMIIVKVFVDVIYTI